MAAAILSIERDEPLVVRRCLQHHVNLMHLNCPIGGPVYMREVARREWRHMDHVPRVERFFRAWEVYSYQQRRVLAVVLGEWEVIWADEEARRPLEVVGRDEAGQALGGRRLGRRGWKPAYQAPRYHIVKPQRVAAGREEEDDPGSIDPASPLGYPPTR